ncbi:MAG: DMT family transporter [Candidatus Nanopelagicales bacterium]|nr:DMT family transporter [Candidatus Nanopelagicales bacterium]
MTHAPPRHRLATFLAAVTVGALVAWQSRINAELATAVGGGFLAAAISFGTGLILVGLVVVLRPRLRRSVTLIPTAVRSGGLRAWHLLGGLGGAWLVTTQGLVVTVVGVTIFTIAVVAGQVSGSLLVDRAGLSPAGRMPVTRNRAVAALVALGAVALASVQGGQVGLSLVVLLAVSAGLGISVQQAINARVAVATHQPLTATLVNFIVGFTALILICVVLLATGVADFAGWPTQWWLYLGGPIGVTFIALAAWAVRRVGVLVFGLLSIGGQLLGSVAMDLVAPTGQTTLGWLQWLGLLLIAAAVALATLPQDRFGKAVLRRS